MQANSFDCFHAMDDDTEDEPFVQEQAEESSDEDSSDDSDDSEDGKWRLENKAG